MTRKKNRRNTPRSEETRVDWAELGKLFFSAAFIVLCIFAVRMIEDISIQNIHVSSYVERVNKKEIAEVVKHYELDGFFTVRLSEFEEGLNNLDWVYKANIKRQWPYTLIIEIEEQTPLFRWNQDKLLNKYADVFVDNTNESFASKPSLKGEAGRAHYLAELYQKYNRQFHVLDISIAELQEDARYDKVMILSNGVRIKMGRGDVDKQMTRCIKTFALLNEKERSAIATIDLRHSNGLAVSWNT